MKRQYQRGLVSRIQKRWKLQNLLHKMNTSEGKKELNETLGVGLWSSDQNSGTVPPTAHHKTYKIPPFDYTYNRFEKSCSIGIDLGTSNSCVSYLDPDSNEPIIVPIEGKNTVPTVIGLENYKTRYFGKEASKYSGKANDMSVCSGKRLLGKNIYDQNVPKEVYEDVITLTQGEKGIAVRFTRIKEKNIHTSTITKDRIEGITTMEFPVVHIIAMFLRYIKTQSELSIGMNVNSACISVPAHFNAAQRKATEDAAIIAGMDVKEIIDEPSAAALAYRELVAEGTASGIKRIAVFDLGGGTFDLAILEINYDSGVSRILSAGGDDTLGGDDFDRLLIDYWNDELKDLEYDRDLSITFSNRVREEAIKAKINLDEYEEVRTSIVVRINTYTAKKVPLSITRFEYEQLLQPLIVKLSKCVDETFKNTSIEPEDVDEVLLVGEMTRTPAVQKYIKKCFKKEPLISSIATPGTIVSLGTTLRIKQLNAVASGESVKGFVYDINSPQYERTLNVVQKSIYKFHKFWKERKNSPRLRPGEAQSKKKLEKGLSDTDIEEMSREVIDNELYMRKVALIKKLKADYEDLLLRISDWKEPRQGYYDSEFDELIEIAKYWSSFVTKQNDREEYMAQAYWELKAYFDELSGASEKTSLEEIASDPELFQDVAETNVRSYAKTTNVSREEVEEEEEDDIIEEPVRTFQR